jgi:hypothetical protein
MTPVGGRCLQVEDVYASLLEAARKKRPVTALYDGLPRLLCPHVLGRSRAGRRLVLCFQSAGGSSSGLRSGPDGLGDWRCLAVEKLSQVAWTTEEWRTEPRTGRPKCIAQIDFDIDAQPGDDPQNGQ